MIQTALAPASAAFKASSTEAIPRTTTGRAAPGRFFFKKETIENLKLHLVGGCGESLSTRAGMLYLFFRSTDVNYG